MPKPEEGACLANCRNRKEASRVGRVGCGNSSGVFGQKEHSPCRVTSPGEGKRKCYEPRAVVQWLCCGVRSATATQVEGWSESVLSVRIAGEVATFLSCIKLERQGWIATGILVLRHFSLRTSPSEIEDPPLGKRHRIVGDRTLWWAPK